MTQNITCPFCSEKDFDVIGLKIHIQRGHCSIFEDMLTPATESMEAAE